VWATDQSGFSGQGAEVAENENLSHFSELIFILLFISYFYVRYTNKSQHYLNLFLTFVNVEYPCLPWFQNRQWLSSQLQCSLMQTRLL